MKIYVFALLVVAAVAFALPANDKDENEGNGIPLLINEDNFLKLAPVGQHAITCTSSLCSDLCRALGYPGPSYCRDPSTCICSR